MSSLTATRAAVSVSLACVLVAALVLSALVSIWFLLPVPVLTAAAYGALTGMTPGRFVDALDGPDGGTGTLYPF
jgi:hypothetical protein